MKNRTLQFMLGFGSLFAFFVFTALVKMDVFQKIDFDVMVRAQDKIPSFINKILGVFSFIGQFQYTLALLIVVLTLRKKISGLIIAGMFIGGHVIEYFLKEVIHQPGPPYLFYRDINPITFSKDFVNKGSSYPSGHSMRAIFLAILFTYLIFKMKKLDKNTKLLLSAGFFGVALLIMIAKISLGAHWPTDIVGGAFLGAGIAALSLLFL